MRKVFSTLLFVLIGLLTLSACSNKKSETGSSPVSSVGGGTLALHHAV